MNQANPVAVVTGVGPGTGAAIARRFARSGYAVTVGATVRRWWLVPKNSQHFHMEAARTFVGAKPVVVQFTATLDTARPPQLRSQPQMQVLTATPLPAI